MSRVGKKPISVPEKVKVDIKGQHVFVEGPKGKLDFEVPKRITPRLEDGELSVSRDGEEPKVRALHGLSRSILNNLVVGVSQGFTKNLEIQGVGFKADLKGKVLTLNLGYSHPCVYHIPDQLNVKVDGGTKISIEGPDKQVVGRVAAEIRGFYPPEPYKGKGVRYSDEEVKRKEGKTVQ